MDRKTETYTYEQGTNRLIRVTGDTTENFTYDANGNTLSENERSYTYNLNNRLVSVSENGANLADYVYNGAGQRVKKITPQGTRVFYYDLYGHLIAETDEGGRTLVEYVFLGDEPLVMIGEADLSAGGDLPGESGSRGCFIEHATGWTFGWFFREARAGDTVEVPYYFHNDHLGTPQAITNRLGHVVWRADYTPFGKANITFEAMRNNLRFPGQYFDKETGLHYNYFRDYHPGIGRYFTPDFLGQFGALDLYLYVGANPVVYVDPVGLVRWKVVGRGAITTGISIATFAVGIAAGSTPTGVGQVGAAILFTGAASGFAFGTSTMIAGFMDQDIPISGVKDAFIQATTKPGTTRECLQAADEIVDLLPGVFMGRLQVPSSRILEIAEYVKAGRSIGKSVVQIERELTEAGILKPLPYNDQGTDFSFPEYPYEMMIMP